MRGETSASRWMLCLIQSILRNNCDVGSLRVEQFNVWRLHLMDDLVLGVNTQPAVELSTQLRVMTCGKSYETGQTKVKQIMTLLARHTRGIQKETFK